MKAGKVLLQQVKRSGPLFELLRVPDEWLHSKVNATLQKKFPGTPLPDAEDATNADAARQLSDALEALEAHDVRSLDDDVETLRKLLDENRGSLGASDVFKHGLDLLAQIVCRHTRQSNPLEGPLHSF